MIQTKIFYAEDENRHKGCQEKMNAWFKKMSDIKIERIVQTESKGSQRGFVIPQLTITIFYENKNG